MKDKNIKNNIEEMVLKKIECGEVSMRPKYYFIIKAGLLIFFAFLIFVTSAILVSFLIFTLSNRGDLFLLSFGKKGMLKFFLMFPWYLLIINAFLLFLLDILLRRFKYGYHSPLVYLFLGTLVFVTVFSFLINYTSFHERMSNFVRKNHVPFAGDFYDDIRKSHRDRGVYRGKVSFIGDDYLILKPSGLDNDAQEDLKVYAPLGLDLKSFIHVGEEVFIAGDIASGTDIVSYGMHKMQYMQ